MHAQFSLFDIPVVPGLRQAIDILDERAEAALIALFQTLPLTPFRFQGWIGKRLTLSFGWSYDFEGGGLARGEAIPDDLLSLRKNAALFAGLAPELLEQVLLTRYDPGAGIGWHRDRPMFDHVVGVSLGAPAVLRLRRRNTTGFERRSVPLAPRSVYHLAGEARAEWEHGIAALDRTRWSITFRSLSDRGRAAVARQAPA